MILTRPQTTDRRRRARATGRPAAVVAALMFLLPAFALQADDTAAIIAGAGIGTPAGPLVTGSDGHRYGVTGDGGPVEPGALPANANGTIFRLAPDGALSVLHVFSINDPANGWGPAAALVEGPDGNFYGTTAFGGTVCADCGTIFRITPQGVHTRLHSFDGTDGASPSRALVKGGDGRLYGVTDGAATGVATLFSISVDGDFRVEETASSDSGVATTQTLAVELLATVQTFDPDTFPFSDTLLLDDFNREDQDSLGSDWTMLPVNFGQPVISGIDDSTRIRSGIVTGPVSGSNDQVGGNYWNTRFDPDQEVYGFFFNAEYDTLGLVVRYDPVTGAGYAVDWDGGDLTLYRMSDHRFDTQLGQPVSGLMSNASDDVEIRPSIWLGLRAAGNNITVWRSVDNVTWTKVIDVTNDQVQGSGHIGFHLYHRFQRFDDFHGGNLDVPPPGGDNGGDDGGDNGGDDGGDGGDGGDDGGDDGSPDNGNPDEEVPVTPITGSPGGGRRGGLGLGATGIEALALLAVAIPASRRRRRIINPASH
jgi:uncharacterized repeat protein (TIGR03803 family)